MVLSVDFVVLPVIIAFLTLSNWFFNEVHKVRSSLKICINTICVGALVISDSQINNDYGHYHSYVTTVNVTDKF